MKSILAIHKQYLNLQISLTGGLKNTPCPNNAFYQSIKGVFFLKFFL